MSTVHACLLMIDMPEYTVLCWLGRSAPKPTVGRMDQRVAQQQIQIEKGSAFRNVVEELCRELGSPVIVIPADPHFTHGRIERIVVKSMAGQGVQGYRRTRRNGSQGGWRGNWPDMLQAT